MTPAAIALAGSIKKGPKASHPYSTRKENFRFKLLTPDAIQPIDKAALIKFSDKPRIGQFFDLEVGDFWILSRHESLRITQAVQ